MGGKVRQGEARVDEGEVDEVDELRTVAVSSAKLLIQLWRDYKMTQCANGWSRV